MDRIEAYFLAASKSFAGQTRQLTIPQEELEDDIFVQPMGCQPLGIASKPLGDGRDLVAITDYYAPAVHLATVERVSAGLRFLFTSIRGVLYEGKSVRMFPNVPEPSMANRLYTVNFGLDDTLWISRGDREFFVLAPPEEGQQKWRLTGRVSLPEGKGKQHYSMESALLLRRSELVTIESAPNLKYWLMVIYSGADFQSYSESPVDPWTYGIGDSNAGELWTVKDYRAAATGLYRGDDLVCVIEGGNGVCFLSDGTALVTCYGAEYPLVPGGKPGQLIIVPPGLLK